MHIELDSVLKFPMNCPFRDRIVQGLVLDNPKFKSAEKFSKNAARTIPKKNYYYSDNYDNVTTSVPLGKKEELFSYCSQCPHNCPIYDNRAKGQWYVHHPMKVILTPRIYQQTILDALDFSIGYTGNGLIVMATGSGKTKLAFMITDKVRKPTLFITHTRDLAYQCIEDYKECFGIEPGFIGDGVYKINPQFTVAIVDSIHSKKCYKELNKTFGLVIVDECFPSNTKVDGRKISEYKVGDKILSFSECTGELEYKTVTKVFKKQPKTLVRVKLSNGEYIDCTEGHPFLTNMGWIPAKWLKGLELYEAPLSNLQQICNNTKKVRETILSKLWNVKQKQKGLLLYNLPRHILKKSSITTCGKVSLTLQRTTQKENVREQSIYRSRNSREGESNIKTHKLQTRCTRGEWKRFNGTPKIIIREIRLGNRSCSENTKTQKFRISNKLQDRYSKQHKKSSNRGGWSITLNENGATKRFKKDRTINKLRVESVTFHQQTSDGKFGGCLPDGYVYNLEVEDNHTYFANNLAVHNCHLAAPDMCLEVLNSLSIKYKIGTTATINRGDGLTPVLMACFGNIVGSVSIEECQKAGALVPLQWELLPTNYISPYDEDQIRRKKTLLNTLCKEASLDIGRNKIIASKTEELCNLGESQLLVLQNIDQCLLQLELLKGRPNVRPELFVGQIGKKVLTRTQRKDIVDRAKSRETNVLLTVQLASIGLDIPILNNLIMDRKLTDQTAVAQIVGRVVRSFLGKFYAKVFDVYDVNVPNFKRQTEKRILTYNMYRKLD